MTTADPRCYPPVELDLDQVRAMLSPLVAGDEIRDVARAEGGLVNTIYRVATDRGVYALRVYASGNHACERELRVLRAVQSRLPVPDVLLADASCARCPVPYVAYRWIDGITLNELRRSAPGQLPQLAERLGRLVARIAGAARDLRSDSAPPFTIEARHERAQERLASGIVRERLSEPLGFGHCRARPFSHGRNADGDGEPRWKP